MNIVEEILVGHKPVERPAMGLLNKWCKENDVTHKGVLYNRILDNPIMQKINTDDIIAQMKWEIEYSKTKSFHNEEFEKVLHKVMVTQTIPSLCSMCKIKNPDIEWFRKQILE